VLLLAVPEGREALEALGCCRPARVAVAGHCFAVVLAAVAYGIYLIVMG